MKLQFTFRKILPLFFLFWFLPLLNLSHAKIKWKKVESKHFVILYLEQQQYLVQHVLHSAENALEQVMQIFSYKPSEKISIIIQDISDYGSAGATSIPHNTIRLGIAPLESGYENIPYTERIRWLLAHELVHIAVNDMATGVESLSRSLFSKVPPEKEQPLSIFYSLLTGYSRYTPDWHQEGVAAFMETWLNGGFGRGLSNFDEMFFRAAVLERKAFSTPTSLVTKEPQDSFLLGTINYLYGARFIAFLAAAYDVEKVLAWYSRSSAEFYKGLTKKFKDIFKDDFSTVWRFFLASEMKFQLSNLKALMSAPLTEITRIHHEALGWVTQPFMDRSRASIIFGNHQSHKLTSVNLLDLRRKYLKRIGTLPTPSLIRIASTAYDAELNNYFYSTKNNQLYRDTWVLNLLSGKKRLLFKNARIGNLAVSPSDHILWGVRHANGKVSLVVSAPPYNKITPLLEFDLGNVLYDLSISPSGRFLAATLHQPDGSQSIILAETDVLRKGGALKYKVVTTDGSPEFPSWSLNGLFLYWNAFTNGVSNIYRYELKTGKIDAMSHCLRGLFRPLHVSAKHLFAFEFTSDGFLPVFIPNKPAAYLPAIQYFGQKTLDRNPQVGDWAMKPINFETGNSNGIAPKHYSGLTNLKVNSFFPVLTGFQNRKVVGLYTHLADAVLTHDFIFEGGFNPFNVPPSFPRFHFRGKYLYKSSTGVEFRHNAPSFFDLFNKRKAGMLGTKVSLTHTHYWKFDNPHKIKQDNEISFFKNVNAIKDNTIIVDTPDFLTFESSYNSRNVRRSIGSVDSESGYDWTVTLAGLISQPANPVGVVGLNLESNRFITWGWNHNVLHFQFAGGYTFNPNDLAIGKLYFGGFGNRELENKEVKQYSELFRFPGRPIYDVPANSFGKIMLAQNLPPVQFGGTGLGQHFLDRIDVAVFSQGLLTDSNSDNILVNLGGQINLALIHWYNLESTLSAGIAYAWSESGGSREWFLSFKLLRD